MPSLPPSSGRALRLGLVGHGAWGRKLRRTVEALAVEAPASVTLAAVAVRHEASAAEVPDGIAVYRDWRRMPDEARLDGLLVAVPPAAQADIAATAIERGLPVFLEKPLALSSADAWRLVDLAKSRGAVAVVDHVHLFSTPFRRLQALARTLGPVRRVRAVAGNRGPFRTGLPPLWDWGVHDVAMTLALVGALPTAVAGRRLQGKRFPEGEGERFRVEITFPDGATAELEVGNGFEARVRRYDVSFDERTLTYEETNADGPRLVDATGAVIADSADGRPLSNAIAYFADRIRAAEPCFEHMILGAETADVLVAAEEASR